MSYANGTTHYNLPQTVGTDKRDWFDTNEAFANVDSALHTASETASSAASDIVTLGGRVTDLETASGSQAQDIVDIKADILSQGGAITRLDGEIDDVRADALDMICAVDEGTAQVATVAVSEGEYFRYNDVLYIATANIAIGDTIIPNTNCTATNVATELQAVSAPSASDVSYDNTSSGMSANDVQEAIDELNSGLSNKMNFAVNKTALPHTTRTYTANNNGILSIKSNTEYYSASTKVSSIKITLDNGYEVLSYITLLSDWSASSVPITCSIPMKKGQVATIALAGVNNDQTNLDIGFFTE